MTGRMVNQKNSKRGRLITLEGGEGAGKSSILPVVQHYLTAAGIEVLQTREPGGTELGEQLRDVLLTTDQEIVPTAELLLMFAARAQHIEKVIEPALQRGCWVVCDRFTDSSFAYQGGGRQIGSARVETLERWLLGSMKIDLTLLLDVTRKTSLARISTRTGFDRIEAEGDAFFERVKKAYLDRARANPHRIKVIDANEDIVAVTNSICAELKIISMPWVKRRHSEPA